MKYIVFANGYRTTESLQDTSKVYLFRKNFITEVDDIDTEIVLNKTSEDIQWCPNTSKAEKPFKTLESYCKEKGYKTKDYLRTHLLTSS